MRPARLCRSDVISTSSVANENPGFAAGVFVSVAKSESSRGALDEVLNPGVLLLAEAECQRRDDAFYLAALRRRR